MSNGKIKLRIFPDGRVEAEIDGIAGSGCTNFIPLVEQLVGGETIDSKRTENYFLNGVIDTEPSEIETARVKGSR
jgi:hypothetical protein